MAGVLETYLPKWLVVKGLLKFDSSKQITVHFNRGGHLSLLFNVVCSDRLRTFEERLV